MNQLFVSVLTAGLLAWGAGSVSAQVPPKEIPPGGEVPPPPPPPKVPAAESLPLIPGPSCHHGHAAINILPVEQAHPVQILLPREVITTVKRPTLAIVYRDVKKVVTDFELKPQEVLREVPCTVMQPCQELDPHTGKVCTVMKPVTTMKLEKETVFVTVPVQRELIEKVPAVEPVMEEIPQRNILLEWRTELQTKIGVIPAPTEVFPPQYLLTPHGHGHAAPGCTGPGCPAAGPHHP